MRTCPICHRYYIHRCETAKGTMCAWCLKADDPATYEAAFGDRSPEAVDQLR